MKHGSHWLKVYAFSCSRARSALTLAVQLKAYTKKAMGSMFLTRKGSKHNHIQKLYLLEVSKYMLLKHTLK